MWACRSVTQPLNVFDFTVSRHRHGPDVMLADFRGTLVAYCYAGYEGIALRSEGRIRRAACVAHARRKVFDSKEAYLSDGRIPIDNNEVEQLMTQVAIGRKNSLFIGSVPAGERAADVLTLVSSAVRNDLDVWAYLKDVLDRLLVCETDYAAFRPDRWRQTHPEAIHQYCVTERRDRADRKQYRRAARRRTRAIPPNS